MSKPTDGELMVRYAADDAAAFAELFQRFERRAFAYFMRRTGSPDRASDLYQELFLRIHRFRDRYDPSRPFEPWFFQVAHNVYVDGVRVADRLREVALDEAELPAREPDSEHRLRCREQARQLLRCLPDEQAAVLVASKAHGADYAEIAARIGKSVDAVKQSASRSLRRLRAVHARLA
jgi:RNA polymerase sigma-70 factor (ECF subfamily)